MSGGEKSLSCPNVDDNDSNRASWDSFKWLNLAGQIQPGCNAYNKPLSYVVPDNGCGNFFQ